LRYLVMSDTHGNINNAIRAIEREKCDYCIHLGDIAQDCEDLQNIFPRQKFIFVKGNNDFWLKNSDFPDLRVFNLDGKRFFLCHGHRFHVKQGLYSLIAAAKKENADIVLFGHTHHQLLEEHDGMKIINPGSYSEYAIITINGEDVQCEVFGNDS